MACFQCVFDGTRICDPVEADLRCMTCGRCKAEAAKKELEDGNKD